MTPEQALNLLAQASAQASLPLAAHQQVQQAINVLLPLVKPPAPAE